MTSGRKDCRAGNRCQPKPLAEAIYEAIYCQAHHSGMTLTRNAEIMEVNPSTLNNWADPEHDSAMPLARLAQLLQLTDDNPAFLRWLAAMQGHEVVAVPTGARALGTAQMLTEFADLLKAIAAGEQAEEIERRGRDLISAVAAEIADAKHAAAPRVIPISAGGQR